MRPLRRLTVLKTMAWGKCAVEYLARIGLLVLGIFVGLLGLEIFGRVLPEVVPYPIQNSIGMARLARSDPALGITIAPGQARIQSPEFIHTVTTREVGCRRRAFRDDGLDDKKPRILALGDSFTWGVGVANEQTWPEVLEQLAGADVINAGYPGIGTRQELILFKECGPVLKPDITILAFFINDFANNVTWRQEVGLDRSWYSLIGRPLRVWLAANSYTYAFFKYYLLGPLGIGDFQNVYWSAAEMERHYVMVNQDNLRLHLSRDYTDYFNPDFELYDQAIPLAGEALLQMAQEAKTLQTKFLIVILPAKEQVYWHYLEPRLPADIAYQVDLPTNIALKLAQENQITVLDLTPVFKLNNRQQLYWDMDGHMNAAGYRLIAQSVQTFLAAQGWIPKAPIKQTHGE